MSYYGYGRYISVAEKKAKAAKKLKQLKKKNPNLQPVILNSQSLVKTWWGKAWNKNLERYADYSNRIGRGRSYVRHGAVLDLKIKPGRVEAQVLGSGSTPYSVTIRIKAIPQHNWSVIKTSCKGRLDSLHKLLAGKLPKEMENIFTEKKEGLFPTPGEIDFDCSCPDWASMCKHVAASLYGIGSRLDEDPGLFFVLRKVEITDLITETIKESKSELLKKADQKSSRIIAGDAGLSDIFGIDLGEQEAPPVVPRKKTVETAKKKSTATRITLISQVENIIAGEKKGLAVGQIIEESGMEPQKVRNVIFRLKKLGRIVNVSRGVYRTT